MLEGLFSLTLPAGTLLCLPGAYEALTFPFLVRGQ
jgi:hypothetical protein